jgi:hypothetical protein
LAGHCVRHSEVLANDLVVWEPGARHGNTESGRPRKSCLNTLLRDVGINSKEEVRTVMQDTDIWRERYLQ